MSLINSLQYNFYGEITMKNADNELTDIGVNNYENIHPEDIKKILVGIIEKRKIDAQILHDYLNFTTSNISTIVEGLELFIKEQTRLSKDVLDIINKIIDILKEEVNKDLSFEQKEIIINKLMECIEMAQKESKRSRGFLIKVGSALSAVLTVLIVTWAATEKSK